MLSTHGRRRNTAKGGGSIIGAAFIVLITLSSLTLYTLNNQMTEDYAQALREMQQLDATRKAENLEYISVSHANDELNLTVRNIGPTQLHLIYLGIFNETATPTTKEYHALDVYLDSSETLTNLPGDDVSFKQLSRTGNAVDDFFIDRDAGNGGKGDVAGDALEQRLGVVLREEPFHGVVDFGRSNAGAHHRGGQLVCPPGEQARLAHLFDLPRRPQNFHGLASVGSLVQYGLGAVEDLVYGADAVDAPEQSAGGVVLK